MGISEHGRSGQRRRRSLGMMEGGPEVNHLAQVLISSLSHVILVQATLEKQACEVCL